MCPVSTLQAPREWLGAAQHAKGSAHFHTGQALHCFSSNKHQKPQPCPVPGPGAGRAAGPHPRADSRLLLPQQSLYSCGEGTFSSPAGRASSASPAAVGAGRPGDASCLRSMVTGAGRETPYRRLVIAMAEGPSWALGLATGPLAPESRLPLEAREEQVNSMLGLGSRLGSSAGLRGRKGEEEGKTGSFGPVAVLSCNKQGCG